MLATSTTRARIGPLVLNNDFRHPAVLAHEAAALADLSDGRFELGLGAGYNQREYERSGIPFLPRRTRIARLAEAAAIVRALLAGETVSFDGEHYRVRELRLPEPVRSAPILIGGSSRELLAVAAAHADVVTLAGSPRSSIEGTSDYAREAVDRQAALVRELSGRSIELHVLVQWHEVTDDREAAARRAASSLEVSPRIALDSPYVLIGTAAEIAASVHDWHERVGITRFTIFADRPELQPADVFAPVLDSLSRWSIHDRSSSSSP